MATVPTCLRGELIQSEAGTPVSVSQYLTHPLPHHSNVKLRFLFRKFQTATWKQPQALAPVVEKRVTFRSSHFSLLLPPPPILPPRCCPTPSNHNPSSIMVKRQKNTARKSVGGLAKRIELVPVPDRLLRSRSASSRGSRSSSVASAVPTPPPMEIEGGDQGDVMQVEENLDKPEAGDPFTDDVRLPPSLLLGHHSHIHSGVHCALTATIPWSHATTAVLQTAGRVSQVSSKLPTKS